MISRKNNLKSTGRTRGYSDIRFEFEEIKEGRRIDSIKFFIFPNVPKSAKEKQRLQNPKRQKN